MEIDIATNGRTANARPIIFYPPFVFSSAASKITQRMRFMQSYRPEGGLGCGGRQRRIHFSIP